jgi:hypothetical protein
MEKKWNSITIKKMVVFYSALLLTRQDFPVLPTGNTQFLLPSDESRVSNGNKCLKVFSQTIKHEENKSKIKKRSMQLLRLKNFLYVFVSESQNYKVNFTMFITIKAVRNSCVLTM